MLISAAALSSLPQTPKHDHRQVFNWYWFERPLSTLPGSMDFLNHLDDFVSLVGQSQDGRSFEDAVIWTLKRLPAWARRVGVFLPSRISVQRYLICY